MSKNNKIHFITFYTTKKPALDLSKEEALLKNTISDAFDTYKAFSPENIDSIYTTEYPDLNVNEHSRGCFHGFWKWKPYIILKRLLDNDVDYGDIVIYADCNLSRYQERIIDFKNLRTTTEKLFSIIECDFLISEDHNNLKIEHHVKPETARYIMGRDWELAMKLPLLHANIVYARKSDISINIVNRWRDLCLQENLLLPNLPEEEPLRWHTHDQAIITSLCCRLMREGTLPKYWPGFYYDYNLKKIIFSMIKNNRIFYNG
jgi:hypothetical protein